MSILDTIKRLINGSPDAQAATSKMIEVLAAEAIKTGNPDALVAVAAQWEQLLDGSPAALPSSDKVCLPVSSSNFTSALELQPIVIKIMQNAYLGGVMEVTTGTIQKQLNQYMLAHGGWKDGDLEDVDPRPGIQHRWKKTLSVALKDMRDSGDISNDPRAWKTYVLAPRHLPLLPAGEEPKQLTGQWELV